MQDLENPDNLVRFPRFSIGQVVSHKNFRYRGVIFDVDTQFQGTEDWYKKMAISKPPKNRPWYHVLVHNSTHTTYVAERNLVLENLSQEVEHPLIQQFFVEFKNGRYHRILN